MKWVIKSHLISAEKIVCAEKDSTSFVVLVLALPASVSSSRSCFRGYLWGKWIYGRTKIKGVRSNSLLVIRHEKKNSEHCRIDITSALKIAMHP